MRWTRQGTHARLTQGLYDPSYEKDACGIGMITHIQGKKTRSNIRDSLTLLSGLKHRGAQGADAESGDGCGILCQIPHSFFKEELAAQKVKLGVPGSYAVGMFFLPEEEQLAMALRQRIAAAVETEGLRFLVWRQVPIVQEAVGQSAQSSLPGIWQLFIDVSHAEINSELQVERELYCLRRVLEKRFGAISISSFSAKTIVYKGLILPERLSDFYPDLMDLRFESAIAIVHSRFSTNTFPTWSLAHPYRLLCHNGEINTLKGNLNWMRAREAALPDQLFGRKKSDLLPIIEPEQSDSACLDNALEYLILSGRSIAEAIMMLIPEPWGERSGLLPELDEFYRSRAPFMEPWDGPAALCFSDGTLAGAALDRNGLRPCRYVVTRDNRIILASESGALPLAPNEIVFTGRLEPGKMLLVDTEEGILLDDAAVKARVLASAAVISPAQVLSENTEGKYLVKKKSRDKGGLLREQIVFGYTQEEIQRILTPMAVFGEEPLSSMGWDAPLAVLSLRPQLLFHYFKQLFAQVTNPPIDPIREERVMSLTGFLGSREEGASRIQILSPVLSFADRDWISGRAKQVSLELGDQGLESSLNDLCDRVEKAVDDGADIVVMSDFSREPGKLSIPSMLAIGAVHQDLIAKGKRNRVSMIVETGEAREVHHVACLIGYGAEAVHPYLALETSEHLKGGSEQTFIKALNKGLLKIFSKMGISTFQSYCGAQLFEAIGIGSQVMNRCFPQSASRIGGIGFFEIEAETRKRAALVELDPGGEIHYRAQSEAHSWGPGAIYRLQHAARSGSKEEYQDYSDFVNDQPELLSLRQLLDFDISTAVPIPLDQVEPAQEIVKRFTTGAMSLGAISTEAHVSLAFAMNRIGAKSNSGEGGEDASRFGKTENGESANSAIKQVASGRFGVTAHYLVNASEIQIKMAQGAKPGEGGQLPGHKVDELIARLRHSVPGVQLISPPPHHDIYSIEDLAQLIFDLKSVNPRADVSVKLVAEVGVGTIAAGVVKAKADKILISGDSGGTGASPLSSIRHAGIPWELGLAETHQTLLVNGLRSRVRIETDGQLRTGRDVVMAALLGAEEFGFATAPLIVQGCIMMRKCHLNTCPVGIATQDPILRQKFSGKPEYVVNYFFFVAEEVRQWMATLGFRTVDEMVGRVERLKARSLVDHPVLASHPKAFKLDLSLLLYNVNSSQVGPKGATRSQEHQVGSNLDRSWIDRCSEVLLRGGSIEPIAPMKGVVSNSDRAVGSMLSGEIARRFGAQGLPDRTIQVDLEGVAGQSFGAFLTSGVELRLLGQANDYVGKGLSGGTIVIRPAFSRSRAGSNWILAGNTSLYGATSGAVYIAGTVGERFAVRNSGACAVVEGVGDHGCEYMTGGIVVILGPTGKNFGAGMSGGIAFVYDELDEFRYRCNLTMIELEAISDSDESLVFGMMSEHQLRTGSLNARKILDNWKVDRGLFKKVLPLGHRKILNEKLENLHVSAAI